MVDDIYFPDTPTLASGTFIIDRSLSDEPYHLQSIRITRSDRILALPFRYRSVEERMASLPPVADKIRDELVAVCRRL